MVDVKQCRRSFEARLQARRQRDRRRWSQARADAEAIVAHIAHTYRPERILQWGSVLEPERFDSRSDIDIAVEGAFDAETWFRLLGEVWTMTELSLDVVDLGRIESEFADIIRMKGKVVYERDPIAD